MLGGSNSEHTPKGQRPSLCCYGHDGHDLGASAGSVPTGDHDQRIRDYRHAQSSEWRSTPSEGDIKVTRDLIRAGQLLRIELLDHVIVGNPGSTSLRSLGYFHN